MDEKRGKNGMIVDEGPGRVEVRQCQGVPGEDTFGKQCCQHCPQHHHPQHQRRQRDIPQEDLAHPLGFLQVGQKGRRWQQKEQQA